MTIDIPLRFIKGRNFEGKIGKENNKDLFIDFFSQIY